MGPAAGDAMYMSMLVVHYFGACPCAHVHAHIREKVARGHGQMMATASEVKPQPSYCGVSGRGMGEAASKLYISFRAARGGAHVVTWACACP